MYEIKLQLIDFSRSLYPLLGHISLAILATLLVIYGSQINQIVKRHVSGWHFIFRTLIFILLCTFGYGALLVYGAPLLGKWLGSVSPLYLGPVVLLIFISLGVLAERKNHI